MSLVAGLTHHIVVREGEIVPTNVHFIPGMTNDTGALWVGNAFVRVARGPVSGRWAPVRDDRYSKRFSGLTAIAAVLPWGNLLAAEQDEGVIEIEPQTGVVKKLPAFGRHPRLALSVTQLKDGRVVVYSGGLHKFVADKPGSVDTGMLYVASFETQRWIPLVRETPILKRAFKDQADLLARVREAGPLAGGSRRAPSPIDTSGPLVRYSGQIYRDQTFTFAPSLRQWPSDFYSTGEDGLLLHRKGQISRIAAAPRNATFSAPAFARQGRTMFLAVKQGRVSESHWPEGGTAAPQSAIIAVEGPILEAPAPTA
ncbi:MAG: hypothetical protein H7Z43_09715 [Clostridia bacterium]|nr:hypothetical protein [Deltaproteobacteria bacterium]